MWNRLSVLFAAFTVLLAAFGCEGPKEIALKEVEELTVELIPKPATDAEGRGSVTVRFHNKGTTPVSILKPIDGSYDGRGMPYYRFTVRDSDDQPLKMQQGCNEWGLWKGTKWPCDYLVEIAPGTTYDGGFCVGSWYEVTRDGAHTLSFEYVYKPVDERFEPPDEAWRGSVKAADVTVYLQQNKQDRFGKDKDK
jgi:hypothetical protein